VAQPSFAIASPDFHPRTCGIGDHSLRLAAELGRRGYPVEIFARGPALPHPEAPEVPIHGFTGAFPLAIAEQIRRALTRGRPTHLVIQYTHHMWGAWRFGSPASTWLAAAARRAGVDVTIIAHELFTELAPRPDLLVGAALQRAQIMAVARSAHRLLVTTDTRVAELMPYWRAAGLGGQPGVMRVGPNALPVPRARAAGPHRLGLFSTLATNKRFDVVLDAFEQVWRRRPDSELVLIGDIGGREDRRVASVREAIDRHPARAQIQVTGKLPLAEVARHMAELDVYLFPMTTGANTRSGTLPVALGCGLPVVATKGIQTDELFEADENVVFAPSLSGDAFGASVLRVLDDPALAARLSAGARHLYERHLAWPVIVDRFLAALGGGAPEKV
jgi:glycosyltransferase involved in cell wall biosynthesis